VLAFGSPADAAWRRDFSTDIEERDDMMNQFKRLTSAALAAVLFAAGSAASAQTQQMTDTFQVRINVQGTCAVLTATDIDFGAQISGAGTHDQTGTIRIQCTKDLPFTLGLDGGSTTGDVNARAMISAAGVQIPYTLRQGSGSGTLWGNDSSNWFIGTGLGLGSAFELALTVHARATLTGNEPAGTYEDTVTATLTY
jgi:spore coat protein U-like protein